MLVFECRSLFGGGAARVQNGDWELVGCAMRLVADAANVGDYGRWQRPPRGDWDLSGSKMSKVAKKSKMLGVVLGELTDASSVRHEAIGTHQVRRCRRWQRCRRCHDEDGKEKGSGLNGTAVVVVTIGQRRPVGRMRVWHVHCE